LGICTVICGGGGDDQREESDGIGVSELILCLGTGRGGKRAAGSVRPLSEVYHQETNPDSYGYPNPQSHADADDDRYGDSDRDSDTDPDAQRYSHRGAQRLLAIEFDWGARTGYQCHRLCPTWELGECNDRDRGSPH
jgi:hypothetical protein